MRKTVDVAEGQCEKRAGCSGVGESPKRKGTPVQDLVELLKNNPYPGRGIVVGKDTVYYFIMGRSVNSRNRIFAIEPDGIRTEAHDPALLEDPSLIIYHPVRTMGDALVVTNGDQTDTIVEAGDFRAGCMQREYEPDAPNFTPRISGLLYPDGHYALSILKAMEGSPRCCQRSVFDYDVPRAGMGHIIYTYEGDGTPLPSFCGEPRAVTICGSQEDFTAAVWYGLHAENRVSLFTAFIDRRSGEVTTRIVNRNQNLGV